MSAAALYVGQIHHTRLKPARHHLKYAVFMALFDIDALEEVANRVRGFAHNRISLLSFFNRDHGDGSCAPLRLQIEAALHDAGVDPPGGAIRMLCMPRVLGAAFNPLSVYFCYDKSDAVRAIVHEVHNTYGERHFYALTADAEANGRVFQQCDKAFRVSPLTPMQGSYRFNIHAPDETIGVSILMSDAHGPLLSASFNGERQDFTSGNIVRNVLAHPLLALKVVAGIHWEALITWIKLGFVRLRPARRRAAKANGK